MSNFSYKIFSTVFFGKLKNFVREAEEKDHVLELSRDTDFLFFVKGISSLLSVTKYIAYSVEQKEKKMKEGPYFDADVAKGKRRHRRNVRETSSNPIPTQAEIDPDNQQTSIQTDHGDSSSSPSSLNSGGSDVPSSVSKAKRRRNDSPNRPNVCETTSSNIPAQPEIDPDNQQKSIQTDRGSETDSISSQSTFRSEGSDLSSDDNVTEEIEITEEFMSRLQKVYEQSMRRFIYKAQVKVSTSLLCMMKVLGGFDLEPKDVGLPSVQIKKADSLSNPVPGTSMIAKEEFEAHGEETEPNVCVSVINEGVKPEDFGLPSLQSLQAGSSRDDYSSDSDED